MTLVVACTSPESIWMLVDRRLSYGNKLPPKDDARKLLALETVDGMALLGYAGLGATRLGTQPADWMNNVLRGRNAPLEQSLQILVEAMKSMYPKHMTGMPGRPTHNTLIPAFVGNEARLYSIDIAFSRDRRTYKIRWAYHKTWREHLFGLGGSGAHYLSQNQGIWARNILRLVKASERRRISPNVVADHLAALNYEVHQNLPDRSVGPRCLVVWRHSKGSIYGGGRRALFLHRRCQGRNLVRLSSNLSR